MITATPQYLGRPSDEKWARRYLGGTLVELVRDVDTMDRADLHVDAAVTSFGGEVIVGRYRMTPHTARKLADAIREVADKAASADSR